MIQQQFLFLVNLSLDIILFLQTHGEGGLSLKVVCYIILKGHPFPLETNL